MEKNRRGPSGCLKGLLLAILAFSTLSTSSFGQDGSGGTTDSQPAPEAPTDTIRVVLDIKPGSCENPLNIRSGGKTPAAILGLEFLDVHLIDPLSLLMNGEAVPSRWSIEDVAGPPVGPMLSPAALTDDPICTIDGADGLPDLTLKFNTRDIVNALFGANDDGTDGGDEGSDAGDNGNDGNPGRGRGRTKLQPLEEAEEAVITITGNLMDGTPFLGRDVVRIKRKGKPDFDGDGNVGFGDFLSFAEQFGRRKGHAKFEISFDLDDDGDIGFSDFLAFVKAFVEAARGIEDAQSASKPAVADPSGQSPALTLRSLTTGSLNLTRLAVELSQVTEASAYQFVLRYDPAVVELVSATGPAGSVYGNGSETVRTVSLNEELEPGTVLLADAFRPEQTLTGGSSVTDLTFRVLDPSVPGTVEILNVFVADIDGNVRSLPNTRLGDLRGQPGEYALRGNYPNPFNPTTQIVYQLPESGLVSLIIYNTLGQEVRTLVQGVVQAGFHQVAWDGDNAFGRRVASGIYLARMEADGFRQVRKMMLLK